ncbi:MAG TPA: TM0106 family RecB-like putative nuclease [Acidobacteriota bacterium]|nr:TM0106 family RecB-like putative nuclease [Acidobacteriota bacterium]
MSVVSPIVRASDLYDLACCPHRPALDRRLDRDLRTPPDEATKLLLARGNEREAAFAGELGYPEPEYPRGDFAAGARRTAELMRGGAPGIYQAVLFDGEHLAVADLVEREADGSYAPGDIKSSLTARADQALQVAYAGWLLGRTTGAAPRRGFLIFADGRREWFALGEIAHVLDAARRRAEAIVAGREETEPFFTPHCDACRWSGVCVPEMERAGDLSLVDGMTPARRETLRAEGIATIEALAALDGTARRRNAPDADGVEALALQARALLSGEVRVDRPFELPTRPGRPLFVHVEANPLEGAIPLALAWGAQGRAEVRALDEPAAKAEGLAAFARAAEASAGPVFHFGAATPRALARLADDAGWPPERIDALERRFFDLGRALRRGAAFLPVRRYRLEEVDAALFGAGEPTPPAFALREQARRDPAGPWSERFEAAAAAPLARMERLLAWMRGAAEEKR